MTADPTAYAKLARVTDAALAAEHAKLAQLRTRETVLRAQLKGIEAEVQSRAATISNGPDAALLAGADMRWHMWIEDRRVSLIGDLARIMAEREARMAGLALAFGRNQVAERLATAKYRALQDRRDRAVDRD